MDWKFELLVVPVSDIDRAKAFYADQVGFVVDVDFSAGEDFRVVQLTPPGSACSISLMRNTDSGSPVKGMHLVVNDVDAGRAELVTRGVEVTEVFHFVNGTQTPGPDPQRADFGSFMNFEDPDGNTWVVQEVGYAGRAS